VIQAQQSTNISGTIIETIAFCPQCENQMWELIKDSRFPNGDFVRSVAYPNLVWDSESDIATSGNPIILYQQKDTLVETKNQRWILTSANQIELILNENYYARVTHSTGHVYLAYKNSSDPYQKFYQFTPQNVVELTITNWLPNPISTSFQSIVGYWAPAEQLYEEYVYNVPLGANVSIYYLGELIYNTTVTSNDMSITIPRHDLPIGAAHEWVGWSRPPPDNGPNDATLTLTWNNFLNQSLTGSGTDNYGNFTIEDGDYDLGGNVGFNRVYATVSFHSCAGGLGNSSTTLTGVCYDSNWVSYEFNYTMVN